MNCRHYIITTTSPYTFGIKIMQLKPKAGHELSIELWEDNYKIPMKNIIDVIKNNHNRKYPNEDMVLWVDKNRLLSPIFSEYREKNIAELVFSGVLEPYDNEDLPWK